MGKDIKNPWLKLPKQAPFILEEDAKILKKYARKHGLDTSRLPEPFNGKWNAPLVFLNLNPSTGTNDNTSQVKGSFAKAVRNNLNQSPAVKYPFYYLNPKLEKHEGAEWWKRKLKEIVKQSPDLKKLSKKILAVEFFPYPSKKWFSIGKNKLAGDDFRDWLVKNAIKGEADIIIMKGAKRWLDSIPELKDYKRTFVLSNGQNSNIRTETLRHIFNDADFRKIINRL